MTVATPAPATPPRVREPGPAPAVAPPPPGSDRRGWDPGRVALVLTGSIGLLLSLIVAAAGSMLLGMDIASRGHAGFVMSGDDQFATETYALVSENITIHADAPSAMVPETLVGDTQVRVTGAAGAPIFVGVAATDDVADYLERVGHAEVVDLRTSDTGDVAPVYDVAEGRAPAVPPSELDIWSAQASGTGTVSLVWPPDEGDWTLVVMNADGSADVAADVSVGASLPWLGRVSATLLVGATLGLLLSLATLWAASQSGHPTKERDRVPG